MVVVPEGGGKVSSAVAAQNERVVPLLIVIVINTPWKSEDKLGMGLLPIL